MSIDAATPLPETSQHEEQGHRLFEKIAVIAADHAGRLIVVAHVPAIWCQAGFGKSARWMRAARERSLSKARCSALVRWSRQNRTNGSASRRSAQWCSWHVSQSPNVP